MPQGQSSTIIRYDLAMPAVVTQVLSATQFVASALAGMDSGTYQGYSAWLLSKWDGAVDGPKGENPKYISAFDGRQSVLPTIAGTITHIAFTTSLEVGDTVLILNPAVSGLFGGGGVPIASVRGSTTALWNTAEANLVTLGTAGQVNRLNSLMIDINGLAGNISIRLYAQINGTERRIYPIPGATTFSVAADAPGIPVVDGPMNFYGQLRVTIQSDNAADDGVAVPYEAS